MRESLRPLKIVCLALCLSSALSACRDRGGIPYTREAPQLGEVRGALNAYCDVSVVGVGEVDIEREYLPRVVNCENGAASMEALKAQAVAARSYLYYKINDSGEIQDGQIDQVYGCGRDPGPQHYEAVEATSGEVLSYQDAVIAAFYVAGAIPSTSSCEPLASDPDPTNTERYVTYNQGRSGDNLTQTTLGYVAPSNIYNRGCQSQNGADCLSDGGAGYLDILRFYYGADITLERATGACINDMDVSGGSEVSAGETSGGAEVSAGETSGGAEVSAGEASGGAEVSAGETSGGAEVSAGADGAEGGASAPVDGQAGVEAPGGERSMPAPQLPDDLFLSPPASLSPCDIPDETRLYSAGEACAWRACDQRGGARSAWMRGERGHIAPRDPLGSCGGGWLLSSPSGGVFTIALSTPEPANPEDQVAYRLEVEGSAERESYVTVNPDAYAELAWVSLAPQQRLWVTVSNLGEDGVVSLEGLRLNPRAASSSGSGVIGGGQDEVRMSADSEVSCAQSAWRGHRGSRSHQSSILWLILLASLGIMKSAQPRSRN